MELLALLRGYGPQRLGMQRLLSQRLGGRAEGSVLDNKRWRTTAISRSVAATAVYNKIKRGDKV